MKTYRDNGAVGALLDEYERAIRDLIRVIEPVRDEILVYIVDPETEDPDCRSIQTILTHVLRSGYGYATTIRDSLGDHPQAPERMALPVSSAYYVKALAEMMQYTERVFDHYPDIILESMAESDKILTRWGQRYDVEQLMEHAIVHVLRHRRQIERFLSKLN